jgi:protein-disulfide isomerase
MTNPHCPGCSRLSHEVACTADELAFWKFAAIRLQVASVLQRWPTEDDEDGKTWDVVRARLEAEYRAECSARIRGGTA